ncbi:3-dehydroquinate synthase [Breznakiella homolactica]|uniref:3-dehydroquinate synthase n=2 Tax=Breznakiella homolactica TaxID=2798577 RepID=A0A7T7XS04_9SPIR|nr:3-dehydroquinate synthase [Breznakiella homolactica]
MQFTFGSYTTGIHIRQELPSADDLFSPAEPSPGTGIIICDENTLTMAEKIRGDSGIALCVLPPGEGAKNWAGTETILQAASKAGLGRDGLFIAVGGGVITDLSGFAASIYMRGVRCAFVSTTLLGMVDASVGGKTGIDLWGAKNMAGTFYPAGDVYMPMEALATLPRTEWKSGLAELIKTAVIGDRECLRLLEEEMETVKNPPGLRQPKTAGFMEELISRAVSVKGRIVESDPRETGENRALLNLGHTFGHALESSLGLGKISHGEAVAWGMARAAELGEALGVCSGALRKRIIGILSGYGYEIRAPYPGTADREVYKRTMEQDKKKKAGSLRFIIPDENGARIIDQKDIPGVLWAKIIQGCGI